MSGLEGNVKMVYTIHLTSELRLNDSPISTEPRLRQGHAPGSQAGWGSPSHFLVSPGGAGHNGPSCLQSDTRRSVHFREAKVVRRKEKGA